MPRDFSADGAAGAGIPNAPGTSVPSTKDWAKSSPSATDLSSLGPGAYANGALEGFGGVTSSPSTQQMTPQQAAAQYGSGILGNGALGGGGFGLAFEDGGDTGDGSGSGGDTNGSPQQDAIQKALSTVDGVLAFGRQLHGLGGGDNEGAIQTGDKYQSFNKSPNVQDRRSEGDFGSSVTGPINNFAGNAYSIYNRATGYGINPDDANNPVGQAAGVNNVDDPKNKTLQGLGDDGTLDDTQGGQ